MTDNAISNSQAPVHEIQMHQTYLQDQSNRESLFKGTIRASSKYKNSISYEKNLIHLHLIAQVRDDRSSASKLCFETQI